MNRFNIGRLNTLLALLLSIGLMSCQGESSVNLTSQGRALADKGEPQAARDKFEQALKLDPQNMEAYFGLARLQETAKNFNGAREIYEKVLGLQPKHVSAHLYLGNIYRKLGDYDKAIATLLQAQKLSPGDIGIPHLLGKMYLEVGELDKARATLEEASKLDINDHEVHKDLAAAYEGLNDTGLAIREYQAALRLIYDIPKRKEEAEELKRKIRELSSGSAE